MSADKWQQAAEAAMHDWCETFNDQEGMRGSPELILQWIQTLATLSIARSLSGIYERGDVELLPDEVREAVDEVARLKGEA